MKNRSPKLENYLKIAFDVAPKNEIQYTRLKHSLNQNIEFNNPTHQEIEFHWFDEYTLKLISYYPRISTVYQEYICYWDDTSKLYYAGAIFNETRCFKYIERDHLKKFALALRRQLNHKLLIKKLELYIIENI